MLRAPQEAVIATEIELKLSARARDLPAVTRMLEARANGRADGRRARLVSTYFDTPDHELARRGLALRVRERRGRYVQTVKSGKCPDGIAHGTALARGEWEDPIGGPSPDPHAPESGRLLPAETVGRLAPLFRTEVMRRTISLTPTRTTRIEAAIDEGVIVAPGRDAGEAITEIELELKRGDVAALYDAALEVLAVAPVRIEQRSKPERGYRLVAPEPAAVAAVHAAAVDLDPALTGHQALQRIVRACLDQMQQNEAAVLAGLPDGIHQMRVGLRRLRAVLAAFGPMLAKRQRRCMTAELRRLGGALGTARNLDVFLGELVAPARQHIGDIAGMRPFAAAAEARREAAYAQAAETIGSTGYTGVVLRLLRWCDGCGWRADLVSEALGLPIGDIAAQILDRQLKAARRRGAEFESQSSDERHKLRIAIKKLRYAAEVLGGLYDEGAVGSFLRRVKRLQDELGAANDLQVGREIVAELAEADHGSGGIADAGAAVLDWHAHRLAKQGAELSRQVDRLLDSEPFWARRPQA
jgi:triphosphatase